MNWFVFAAGVLYLGGAAVYAMQGRYLMAAVFISYACSNFLLARV